MALPPEGYRRSPNPLIAVVKRGAQAGVLLLALVASAAPASGARFDDLRAEIAEAIDAGEVASVAVGVARGEEILWEEAFGWADVEAAEPATVHTAYPIASVTKPFTATALMRLVERGAVDLERPVNDYLGEPGIESGWADPSGATVLRIARHTAGLPHHHRFYPLFAGDPPQLEEVIRDHGFLVTPPGEEFRYSNLGYALLGRVVERVDGRPLPRFLEEEVLKPLGLEHAALAGAPESLHRRAKLYEDRSLPPYRSDHPGASAMWACVHDLLRFGQFHAGAGLPDQEQILSPKSRIAMQRPGPRKPAWAGGYGIGWSVTEGRGQRIVYHSGRMPGATTVLVVAPLQELVVAVVANTSSHLPLRIAGEILDRHAHQAPGRLQPTTVESGFGRSAERFHERAPRGLRGRWRGTTELPCGDTGEMTLEISKRDVEIAWSGGDEILVLDDGFLRGRMRALIRSGGPKGSGGHDARIYLLSLWLQGDALAGDLREITNDKYGMPRNASLPVRLANR